MLSKLEHLGQNDPGNKPIWFPNKFLASIFNSAAEKKSETFSCER